VERSPASGNLATVAKNCRSASVPTVEVGWYAHGLIDHEGLCFRRIKRLHSRAAQWHKRARGHRHFSAKTSPRG
jgi:hypothetical protein